MKLNHVAVIPDGNRRWARFHGLGISDGHRKGMEVIEIIAKEAKKKGIKYLTAWGCSKDNVTKRSLSEVRFLYKLFKEHFERMLRDDNLHRDRVRVRVIGEWSKYFPSQLKNLARKLEKMTENYAEHNFTLLMAYDGKREMQSAINKARGSKIEIRESNLKNYLWTKDLPPVDLVIRTGEESNLAHWSAGFLMWQTADSEFYFTKTMWPGFSKKEFAKAIRAYEKRPRNLGR